MLSRLSLVVIKLEVEHRDAKGRTSIEALLLFHQNLEELGNRTKPWSHQTYGPISRLKKSGIEILNSQVDRKTVVVWIWCNSLAAFETVQKLYKSNQLREVLQGLAHIQPSTSEIVNSIVVNIDSNQFKKSVGKFL